MHVEPFFDQATSALTYLVSEDRDAVVIDPVLDFDPLRVAVSIEPARRLADHIEARGLRVRMILETHAHADHLSGARWLSRHFGAPVAINTRIRKVQEAFRSLYSMPFEGGFDRLLTDGEVVEAGALRLEVIPTPGHTAACASYLCGDAVFSGDVLFFPDLGTGRCDFPGASAEALFESVQRLYRLPEATRLFPAHDYPPEGEAPRLGATIGQSRRENALLREGTSREEFVAARTARDRTLPPPRLLHPSLQVNLAGGRLPPLHASGRRYLVLPLEPAGEDGSPP